MKIFLKQFLIFNIMIIKVKELSENKLDIFFSPSFMLPIERYKIQRRS